MSFIHPICLPVFSSRIGKFQRLEQTHISAMLHARHKVFVLRDSCLFRERTSIRVKTLQMLETTKLLRDAWAAQCLAGLRRVWKAISLEFSWKQITGGLCLLTPVHDSSEITARLMMSS